MPRGDDAFASVASAWEWIGVSLTLEKRALLFIISLSLFLALSQRARVQAKSEHPREAIEVSAALTTDDRSGQVQTGRALCLSLSLLASRSLCAREIRLSAATSVRLPASRSLSPLSASFDYRVPNARNRFSECRMCDFERLVYTRDTSRTVAALYIVQESFGERNLFVFNILYICDRSELR